MLPKALVVLSGGQDSGTALIQARKQHSIVEAVTFKYGQRHVVETKYAARLAVKFADKWDVVDLTDYGRLVDSALTKKDIPVSVSNGMGGSLPSTFTPGRNMLFLTIACSIAAARGISTVITGVCQTDYSGYPDCRDIFIHKFSNAFASAIGGLVPMNVLTPMMFLTKAETFKLAEELGHLQTIIEDTITCYLGVETQNEWGRGCGTCPACVLRAKGFATFKKSH